MQNMNKVNSREIDVNSGDRGVYLAWSGILFLLVCCLLVFLTMPTWIMWLIR